VALRRDGSVWSWGNNLHGQLGDGTTAYRASPVQVLGPASVGHLSGIVSLAAGSLSQHVLAVRSDGTLWAWGGNSQGCLGDGTTTDRPVPVQVLGQDGSGFLSGVVAATAGFYHSVAVRADGTAWAWGANNTLQLGANLSGFLLESHTPMKVGGP
jgi:alpha-tubulin suppressor-like RCC1 family protein